MASVAYLAQHCKNSSVTSTPNLLYTHTFFHIGVPMEQNRATVNGGNGNGNGNGNGKGNGKGSSKLQATK